MSKEPQQEQNASQEQPPVTYDWRLGNAENNIYLLSLREPIKCLIDRIANTVNKVEVMQTPMGLPMQTTTQVLDPIVDGVDALHFGTRYTICVGVGKAFTPEEVLKNLLEALDVNNLWKM